MSECCTTGHIASGQPTGTETKLAGRDCYVCKEVGVTCYLPSIFNTDPAPTEILTNPSSGAKFDVAQFLGSNSRQQVLPAIEAIGKELSQKHDKVGCVGYCYGAYCVWYCCGEAQFACVGAVAHPSPFPPLTPSFPQEFKDVKVPQLIMHAGNESVVPAESSEALKTICAEKSQQNLDFTFKTYPGVGHGFAVRGNDQDENVRRQTIQAKDDAVAIFKKYLT